MKTFYIIIIFFLLSTNILLSDKYDKEYLKAIEYSNNNEYDNADKIFKKLIQKSIKNKDYYKTLDFYTAEGYNFEQKGEFLKSLDSYSKAILNLNKYSLHDYKNKLYLFKNFANINCKLEDYYTALKYYNYSINSINKNKQIDLYFDYKICIATTYLEMGNYTEAKDNLENLFMLVVNEKNKTNKFSVILNLLELNIKLNNIKEVNKINLILIENYKFEILNEYPFDYKLLEIKTSILNKLNNVDKLYSQLITDNLNEYQKNILNKEYGIYLLESKLNPERGISLLNKSIDYFEKINNSEILLEISKILLQHHKEVNIDKYNKIMSLQEKIISKQKKDLFKTIENNEILSSNLNNVKEELREAKLMNYIFYTILISFLIISILILFNLNLKRKYNLNNIKNHSLELKLNEVEFKLSNNIREVQELIYTKDEIDIEDFKYQNKNLVNIINNIRK